MSVANYNARQEKESESGRDDGVREATEEKEIVEVFVSGREIPIDG